MDIDDGFNKLGDSEIECILGLYLTISLNLLKKLFIYNHQGTSKLPFLTDLMKSTEKNATILWWTELEQFFTAQFINCKDISRYILNL